jgi:type VI protein secretion system component VasK
MSFDFPYISNPGGKSVLNGLDIKNLKDLDDAFEVIRKLLNLVETLNQEILELKRQKQDLRDEINRLKGEQGKPKISPTRKPPANILLKKSGKNQKKERSTAKKTASKRTILKPAL